MGRVTIKDLAKASGLSVCTINKALNGKPWISEVTRTRVLALAQELGYTPNRLAQSLARRTLSLAVVYPTFWGHWFDPLVEGVRQGVEDLQDYNIAPQFHQFVGSPADNNLAGVMEMVNASGADGLLVCSGGYSVDLSSLPPMQVPTVLLGGVSQQIPHLTCVRADARRCGRMAAEMLGMFTGSQPAAVVIGTHSVIDHEEKVEGFVNHAAFSVTGVYETFDDLDAPYQITARLFAEHPETRGIYIATDNSAEGVCRYLLEHKLQGRVQVVATGVFSVIKEMMDLGVIQASLFQNMAEQGRLAVQTLYRFLSESVAPATEVLVPPFIAIKSNVDLW